jgi:F420-non-reducing hydrogenase small subunit
LGDKLNFAFYWTAGCGGCEVATLDIDEKILDVAELANIVLWPIAMDFKYEDIENMDDDNIDVSFINGAIRNTEQREIAELLREKSKVVVAFGACACHGGIPSLGNFHNKDEIFQEAYVDTISTNNPDNNLPTPKTEVAEGELTIPEFFDTVYKLDDLIEVEYYLPGCPPSTDLIIKAVEAIANDNLPPVGSVIASKKTVCDECDREKKEKKVKEFRRPYEVDVDPELCLLEQGIICCGSATTGGCGANCPTVNMPCRGCYGPTSEVADQGAKLLSAVASVIDSDDQEEIAKIAKDILDPGGTFYRFGMSNSLLKRKKLG